MGDLVIRSPSAIKASNEFFRGSENGSLHFGAAPLTLILDNLKVAASDRDKPAILPM